MTVAEIITEKVRALPPEKQQEVLDFVEFIERKAAPKKPRRRSLIGLFADLNIDLTEADIAEAREEIWERRGD